MVLVDVMKNGQEGTPASFLFLPFEFGVFTNGPWYPSCSHCHWDYTKSFRQTDRL